MSRDVELPRQRMFEAKVALLAYTHRPDHDPKTHKQLINELQKATKDFMDSVERLAQNPPSRARSGLTGSEVAARGRHPRNGGPPN